MSGEGYNQARVSSRLVRHARSFRQMPGKMKIRLFATGDAQMVQDIESFKTKAIHPAQFGSWIARFIALVSIALFVGFGPAPAAADPFAYVANSGSGTVSVIDTTDNNVVDTVGVGDSPFGVAGTPDGTFVYLTNRESGPRLAARLRGSHQPRQLEPILQFTCQPAVQSNTASFRCQILQECHIFCQRLRSGKLNERV